MGKYSNVIKNPSESKIGGIKYLIKFASISSIESCPEVASVKVNDDDYKVLVGDFVFYPGEDFNILEVVSNTAELKWESVGSKSNLKMKLSAIFTLATMQTSFYRFVEEAKNDEIVMVLERADCSGESYVLGGCCSPAQILKITGGLGKTGEDDIGSIIEIEAYSNGLPPLFNNAITQFLLQEDGDFLLQEDNSFLII